MVTLTMLLTNDKLQQIKDKIVFDAVLSMMVK